MADITMCIKNNNKCKKKETCYRYLAKEDGIQSYSDFFKGSKNSICTFYWEVADKKEVERLNRLNCGL
jgi:hypothetical protein